ncbi:MAG: adenylyltransferase/cytidyltransferase family protein [Candidatus Nanohaloarchaea archaeon]|nr:adenylyltransferase/cytidyltransferase family protein [Candidatus Nanohaloarchaea archaeon]
MKAVFLGRFQPLHLGHHEVIEKQLEEQEEFVVAVGSAGKSREEDNPLGFEERKEIIQNCFPGLEVIGIEDDEKTEEGNRRWAEKLEEKLEADLVISNNELVRDLVEEHTEMDVRQQEMYEPEIYSGTEVRRRIRSGEEWRYLVPGCAAGKIEDLVDEIKESGIQYEFRPGWKKENIQN